MPRTRVVVVLVAVLALVGVALVALPEMVRRLAVTRLAEATATAVSIADVDVNPFTGRFRARALRIGDAGAPVLTVEELHGRLRMMPLFSGRIRLEETTLSRPELRVARVSANELNVTPIIERWRRRPSGGAPLDAEIDRLAVVDGTLAFEDRVLQPVRRWSAEHLSLDLRQLGTTRDADPGSGLLTFAVGTGRVSVVLRTLDVAPFSAEAIVRAEAVPVASFFAYLPANQEVAPSSGRLDASITAAYEETGQLRGDGWVVLRDLLLRRAGQTEPFVVVPALTASATELTVKDGAIGAARVSVSGGPTVVDAHAVPAARFEFASTSLVMRDVRWPGGGASPVEVEGKLTDGASMIGRGTLDLDARSADLALEISNIALDRFAAYIPAAAPVKVRGGILQATLRTRHVGATEVRISGSGTVRAVALTRGADAVEVVALPELAFAVTEVGLIDGVVSAGHVELAGAPILTDPTRSPPARVALRDARVVIHALRAAPGPPASIDVTARMASGGSLALTGTVAPSPLAADVTVTTTDLDLALLRPYLPAAAPVQLDRGFLTATAGVRHAAEGTRVDGTGTVRRVRLRRADGSEPFLRARAVELKVTGLAIADGRGAAERIVIGGAAVLTDTTTSPPTRIEVRDARIAVEALGWPEAPPARIDASARVATDGALTVRGTVAPAPLAVDVVATATALDLAPLRPYLPATAPVQLDRGFLTATAGVRHGAEGTRVDGTGTVRRVRLRRGDGSEPFLRARAVELEVAGLAIADGRGAAKRIAIGGAAVLTDTTTSPPTRIAVRDARIAVEALGWPEAPPARIDASARVATGGALAVQGTVAPVPLAVDVVATATDLDLGAFRDYVPAGSPVRLGRGVVAARTSVTHSGGVTRVDGTATVRRLTLLRGDVAEPFLRAPAVEVEVAGAVVADGRVEAQRISVAGAPTIIDATTSPPQRHRFETVRVTLTDATRPSLRPADLEVVARARGGGAIRGTGRVDLTSLDAEVVTTIEDVPITRAQPYLPADSPLSLGSGMAGGRMTVRYSRAGGPHVSAELTVRDFALHREGQHTPFVSIPLLTASARDVAIGEGQALADRLEVRGDVRIVDAATPPLDVGDVRLVLTGAGWPGTHPARVQLTANVGSGRLQVRGSATASPLRADLHALASDIDVRQIAAHIPPEAGLVVRRGRASASAAVRHDGAGTRVDGQITGFGLEVTRPGETFAVTVPTLTVAIRDGHVEEGRMTAARIEIDGAAHVVDPSLDGAPPVDLEKLSIVVEHAAWPATGPVPVTVDAAFARGGTVVARGALSPTTGASTLQMTAHAIPLAMLAPFLPVHARVRGEIDAELAVGVDTRSALRVTVGGTAHGRALALGPRRRPTVAVEQAAARDVKVDWPGRVAIGTLVLQGLSATVERTETGRFPLRDVLAGPRAAGDAAAPAPAGRPATDTSAPPAASTALEIGHFAIEKGYLRFVDRSTSPFYSEELSELAVTVERFSTAPGARATVSAQGLLGVHAAVDLHGEVAPFGDPFFLEVRGEIRDFPVSRVNPYAQKFLDWIARTGDITTTVHYRVVGDRLEATNEIVVQRLNVARAGRERAAAERLGVPLGLAVALMKDAHGNIRLTVPVTGRLGSPEFSVRDAITTALRNIAVRAVTAPFRLLGKLFTSEDEEVAPEIDPVEFAPGSASVTPAVERELQRVADFLRASPYIALELQSTVSTADLRELAARAVTARIQELQRTRGLPGFDAAALELFRERFGDRAVPSETDAIVAALREAEPTPDAAGRQLAQRRLESTRRMLVSRAGIEPQRLREGAGTVPLGGSTAGRVEFTLITPED